jgi:hypothetical protein
MSSLRAQLTGDGDSLTPVEQRKPEPPREHTSAAPAGEEAKRGGFVAFVFSSVLAAFWVGAAMAYLWGYIDAQGLARMDVRILGLMSAIIFLPPFLFIASGYAFNRAQELAQTARHLAEVSKSLTAADETATAKAQRLGRSVRRELDALSAGLDGAFGRLRALETALEERVAQLEEAGARAGVRADTIAQRLSAERAGIESLADRMDDAAQSAAEALAGRAAQLKALIEAAGGELKSAGTTLETQAAQFRDAADKAAAAPQQAAIELDRQAKSIETMADAAVARAEFVLARQDKQRAAMSDLLAQIKEETNAFVAILEAQRTAAERAASALTAEALRLDEISDQGLRRVDAAMASAGARTSQLATSFARDAERVEETVQNATVLMTRLVDNMREAAVSAQALIAESTSDAKQRSKDYVGEAMAQCDLLLRAAGSVAEEAEKARSTLARAAEDTQRHMVALPGVAIQEAERVREALRAETEQMLDVSARTLATLQTRSRRLPSHEDPSATPQQVENESSMGDSLRGLARRVTGPRRRLEDRPRTGNFELSQVLAAADSRDPPKTAGGLRPGAAASLAALQAALAELAGDLSDLAGETADPALWRRYLDGDRGVFARRLAAAIGPESVNRITELYRDNPRFHDSADAYIDEFEAMLARAREGDRDGFLASTLLTADTGKIYLAIAYALGRLE